MFGSFLPLLVSFLMSSSLSILLSIPIANKPPDFLFYKVTFKMHPPLPLPPASTVNSWLVPWSTFLAGLPAPAPGQFPSILFTEGKLVFPRCKCGYGFWWVACKGGCQGILFLRTGVIYLPSSWIYDLLLPTEHDGSGIPEPLNPGNSPASFSSLGSELPCKEVMCQLTRWWQTENQPGPTCGTLLTKAPDKWVRPQWAFY
jgi:hypothetical protein